MSYSCTDHEMEYEDEPCKLCMRELEIQELKARMPAMPQNVTKHVHVHEPGPCPECVYRRGNERRQRVSLLLAVLFAIAAAVAGNLLHLEGTVKSLVYIPAAVIALLGILVPLREPRHDDLV
jgi:hypothetical protein